LEQRPQLVLPRKVSNWAQSSVNQHVICIWQAIWQAISHAFHSSPGASCESIARTGRHPQAAPGKARGVAR